ncbi:MAG: hypothetical protein NTZ67_08130 [Gammaproteobacteria bacterium]|nr:hypothetical protein [Gammaproteobacteria bacterium]
MIFEFAVEEKKIEPISLTLYYTEQVPLVEGSVEMPPQKQVIAKKGFPTLFSRNYQDCINTDEIIKRCFPQAIQLQVAILYAIAEIYGEFIKKDNALFADPACFEKSVVDFCEHIDKHGDDFQNMLMAWVKILKKKDVNISAEKLLSEFKITDKIKTYLLPFNVRLLSFSPEKPEDEICDSLVKNEEKGVSIRALSKQTQAIIVLAKEMRVEELNKLKSEIALRQTLYMKNIEKKKFFTGFPFFRSKSNSAANKYAAATKMIAQIDNYIGALNEPETLIPHDNFWKTEKKDVLAAANQGELKKLFFKMKNALENKSGEISSTQTSRATFTGME